jgi:hypothetical protein
MLFITARALTGPFDFRACLDDANRRVAAILVSGATSCAELRDLLDAEESPPVDAAANGSSLAADP